MIYKGLVKPVLEYGIQIWGHAITKELTKANKKIVRIINYRTKHTHVEPLLKEMKALQLDDLYKVRVFTMFDKIRREKCPLAIREYVTFHEESSRRWYLIKSEVKLTKLQRTLPKFHQTKAWNNMFDDIRKYFLQSPMHIAKIEIRDSFLEKYYSYCTIKHCYSCAVQKKIDLANLKEYLEKQAEKERLQREKAIAEEQRQALRLAKLL